MADDIVLGFDFGMKRIGVAVGNRIILKATPLKRLDARDGVPDWNNVLGLINEWRPGMLLVGIPLNMDDTKQTVTYAAKKFGKALKNRFKLNVIEVDERLTTVEARQELFEEGGYRHLSHTDIDCLAAKLITEQWLREETTPGS
jgi:putative Holliday junction resolvase